MVRIDYERIRVTSVQSASEKFGHNPESEHSWIELLDSSTDGFHLYAPASKRSNLSLCSSRQYHGPAFIENGSWNCILQFNNESSNVRHALYNFSFRSVCICGWFNFPRTNFTFYTNIGAEITGLSKPVILMDEFAVKDVDV